MGSKLGVMKIAAGRLGVSFEAYQAKIDQGLKWCWSCKQWLLVAEFTADRSRGDGLAAKCYDCQRKNRSGPSKRKRRKMRAKGFAWCCGCKAWFGLNKIRNARCRECRNRYARERYAKDEVYREERKNHRDKHQRGVERVPLHAQEFLLEESSGLCVYCSKPATQWDHIVPISRGGRTTPGNIVPCCKSCNSSKKDRDVLEWIDKTGRNPSPMLFNRIELFAME